VTAGSGGASAVRGHAISFRADPFRDDDALIDISDALIVTRDGLITDFGPHEQVRQRLPRDAEVVAYLAMPSPKNSAMPTLATRAPWPGCSSTSYWPAAPRPR
jgi:hypothetical protein